MEIRSGIRSSEFWLSSAAAVLGALLAAGVFDDPNVPGWITKVVGAAVAVLAALGYGANRASVKSNALKTEASKALASAAAPNP